MNRGNHTFILVRNEDDEVVAGQEHLDEIKAEAGSLCAELESDEDPCMAVYKLHKIVDFKGVVLTDPERDPFEGDDGKED